MAPGFAEPRPRVVLVSLDGAGHEMASRFLAEGALPNLTRIVSEGAWSDGMVSSFPTKTAAAHALLFTGHFGHTSGITGNSLLKVPPAEGSRLETVSGFFSHPLRVDPLWVLGARAGLPSYVLHGTQAYPFEPALRSLDPVARDRLFAAHGYTEVQLRGELLAPDVVGAGERSRRWSAPEARGPEAREIRFSVGESSFRGIFFDDPFDPARGCDTLGIVRDVSDSAFAALVKPGASETFSTPLRAEASGRDVWFSLRLFELDPGCERFLLYRSGAVELALSTERFPGAGEPVTEVFAGNGGGDVYRRGGLGETLARGGSGEAERRLLETERHLQRQIVAQAERVLAQDYGLVVLYSPVTDDVAHVLGGYVSRELAGYDEAVAAKVRPFIREAFELQDRFLGAILAAAEDDGAHVVVVSDHGMTGADKRVQLNVALERAGLVGLTPEREIDLARTTALAPPLSDFSVAANLVDRPGGIVPLAEREAVLREVRAALAALEDPDTGEPIVAGIFEPADSGLLQPGGPSTGDLFLDFAPGYYPSTDTREDAVVLDVTPSGEHGFLPTRRDMLAIFAAWGPRIPPGTHLGKVRAVDVAPTVLDLLDIEAPPDLPGRSLLPERGFLQTR